MQTTSLMFRRVAPLIVATLATLSASCGTKDERGDLVVTKLVRQTASSSTAGGAACIFDPGTLESVFGTVDPTVAPTYLMGAVVENRLIANGNPGQGRVNTNDFQVTQARIRYEFPDPAFQASVAEHVTPANGLVKTGAALPIGVVIFPPDVITQLKGLVSGSTVGTVRAKVTLDGKLLDGSSTNTNEYTYSIRICSGCITARCSDPTKTPVFCAPGQDSDVICQ
jgi:hypothetical protein